MPGMTDDGTINLSQLSHEEYFSGHMSTTSGNRDLTQGDMWHSTTHSGAAGLGDPLERDPELIVQDVGNKMVTLDVAQKAYAVGLDPKTLKIDHRKTEKLRAEKERAATARDPRSDLPEAIGQDEGRKTTAQACSGAVRRNDRL